MNGYAYLIWIPLLPLLGFVLMGLFGRTLRNASGMIGTLLLAGSTLLSFVAAYQYFFSDGKVNDVYRKITAFTITWLQFSPGVSIDMSLVIDPVSAMMLVVVCFVSLMVHVFSLGYMKGETRFATYYAYLSLFTFSMLGLVLAGNLFQVYIFWELVGVSSFLLIGFYYDRPSAVAASKKAFIVTRFADLGFLVGILVMAFYGQSLDIATLIGNLAAPQSAAYLSMTTAGFMGISALTWGLLLIFIGGAGKSAMFPLHIWLPDAMEGPTPVSALIHAATMVVAGVYLVARLFPVFSLDVSVMQVVTWTGIVSALLAALIACTQTDIKRVLAYSTMSQIGYMMFALGISGSGGEDGLGFMASMFHLFTHAFFKSLLFLCAGVIIHFVHSNDMRDMGGLRKLLPVTHVCFLVACLAISGIPPFAGFFSKEEILLAAYHANKPVYFIALFTAVLTAFYMFRLYFSVFWHKEPGHSPTHGEGALSMKLPLIVLLLCTVLAGFIPIASWVTVDGKTLATHMNPGFSVAPVVLSTLAILLAMRWYKKTSDTPDAAASALGPAFQTVSKKFYIDEAYLFVTRKIVFPFIGRPAAWIDRHIVDGAVNGIAGITGKLSQSVRAWQSGKVQSYALYFFSGIALLAIVFIYLWK
ncbi:NADH-quinone oxidoreductase subunit L [Sediminibacterium soli]|uniref:NADH-quinone oxidoreductase subunit L n=1 Tax=Sediminibacterium soli TaxID=2698829 RepID=UPI001379A5D9|nr:NADH-quinone oxidoreductase subunit L [Sediminibacterium soli]NCI47201.1 NADH-quinone oxidoreductase subunit L [Sediminibacterium soli]